jgi:hypothetical protein
MADGSFGVGGAKRGLSLGMTRHGPRDLKLLALPVRAVGCSARKGSARKANTAFSPARWSVRGHVKVPTGGQ